MNEMLLRGCTLKNTGQILGLAVYTGNETRIQKNSAKTPNKIGQSPDAWQDTATLWHSSSSRPHMCLRVAAYMGTALASICTA